MPDTDALSLVFSALADPTRRAILVRLSEGEATVNELAAPFAISLPAISRHLKVLAEAGLIERTRHAQWRTNTLKADGLTGATGFIEDLTRAWGERFDRLDAHLDFLKRQLAQGSSDTPSGGTTPQAASADGTEPPAPLPDGTAPSPVTGELDSSINPSGPASRQHQDGDTPSGEESV
ncbi:MAG: metalloregulator ArsR/SmtB family transcription factor [Solirubrobacteraceae bacterium]|nr:metalloregulator ArsR/SmtB family transcription factor [Solirubrobacteraceae bacterium]